MNQWIGEGEKVASTELKKLQNELEQLQKLRDRIASMEATHKGDIMV